MNASREAVNLMSLGERLSGILFLPQGSQAVPALIVCHGAGEYKENYFELCESLASRGVASLALDMHGHGESAGVPFRVEMREWVADIQSAIGFLQAHPRVDGKRIGAFGLSSGGTAILETALVDSRLKALIALDATVRNSLPVSLSCFLKILVVLGRINKFLTKRDLRVPLAKMGKFHLASDPELDKKLQQDPRGLAALMAFPFPGGAEAFFVDTIKRVAGIQAPTLVLWGEDDQLDPPETARLLHAALTCDKQLHIIPGNGHVGHLDRNKDKVFALTADWASQKLGHAATH
jgi:alpha-beta hydrolase superfamily lysophospholipase